MKGFLSSINWVMPERQEDIPVSYLLLRKLNFTAEIQFIETECIEHTAHT